MNNTPRKGLVFRKPQKVLDEHLHRQTMVTNQGLLFAIGLEKSLFR